MVTATRVPVYSFKAFLMPISPSPRNRPLLFLHLCCYRGRVCRGLLQRQPDPPVRHGRLPGTPVPGLPGRFHPGQGDCEVRM